MSTNGQLVFTDVDKITFKGVGNASNAVIDTLTGKIGVGTDSPEANLHVLGNSYVSTNLELGGTLIMGTVNVEAQHSLEAVTATGNITPLTIEFTNPTTSLVASGNVVVTGNVTADHFVGDGSNITGISSNLDQVVNIGNVTSNTVQFSNAITSLTATSNIEVAGFVGNSGTGALTLPSGTTAQQPSTGLVGGMIRFNSGVNRIEVYNGTAWQSIGGMSATSDGTTTTNGGYKIHTFTTSGTFTVFSGGEIDYLIVAGGGAGATTDGGGGGAGGVVYGTMNVQAGDYDITRGNGGASVNSNDSAGLSGSNSTALGFTAIGGGGGGVDRHGGTGNQGPKSGGSGGGGGSRQGTTSSSTYWGGASSTQNSTGSTGYGNNGGDGVGEASTPSSTRYSGGGGGAGEAGKDGSDSSDRGGGGDGIEWPSGSGTYYGGGGGGGHNNVGQGGQGGGGNGSSGGSTTAGAANTGGGGGGGGNGHTRGGAGGTGIVIIRYLS